MTKIALNHYGNLIVWQAQKRGRWPIYLVMFEGSTLAVFRSFNEACQWAQEHC